MSWSELKKSPIAELKFESVGRSKFSKLFTSLENESALLKFDEACLALSIKNSSKALLIFSTLTPRPV